MKKVFKAIVVSVMVIASVLTVTVATTGGAEVHTAHAVVYKQGNTGSTVRTIQQKLKNWGYYKGSVDGIFGSKTKEAVKYFQRKNGLTVDGIVGNKTLAALGINAGSSNSGATSSYSDSDIALLARLIYGEARGESYVGQVAVGAVVMNRIKSASFPNTMAGVIYLRGPAGRDVQLHYSDDHSTIDHVCRQSDQFEPEGCLCAARTRNRKEEDLASYSEEI